MEKSEKAKTLKERTKKYIPFSWQEQLYNIVKKIRFLKNIYVGKRVTKDDIKKVFKQAGLVKGDIVLTHLSLGRIGLVENGPDDVIDAFLEIIGKDGLLVIPAFPASKYDRKYKMYVFDLQNTPTYTGAVPEVFRKRKGVKRSISITHSFCALGKKAEEFVKNHENCDNPFSMKGPFGKLYYWNAKIFLIGVDQLANTPLHIVEDKIDFPIRVFTDQFKFLAINNGKKKVIKARKHLDRLKKHRDPNILERYCMKYNVMKIYKIGNTELRVLNTKDFVHMMERLTKKGITIYHIK